MTAREEHALTVERFDKGPCAVVISDWPYACASKDKHPTHTVYRCTAHGVWWHE